jgi:hypothetical protein
MLDEHGNVLHTIRLDHEMLTEKPYYAVLRALLHGCSTLVPRQVLLTEGGFNPELSTTQDYDLWFRLMTKVSFVHVPQVLIGSRVHSQQGSKLNPNTLREANALWISFATSLPDQEKLHCEPSVFLFYERLAAFLRTTPYTQASDAVARLASDERARIQALASDTLVSVLVEGDATFEQARETLESALCQTHYRLEVALLHVDGASDVLIRLHQVHEGDARLKLLMCPNDCPAQARSFGIEHCSGEYISVLRLGDRWMPQKVERQLFPTILWGSDLSFSGYGAQRWGFWLRRGSCREVDYASMIERCDIATSTVMLKRTRALEVMSPFPRILAEGEDSCLWLELAEKHPALELPESLASAGQAHCDNLENLLHKVAHLREKQASQKFPAEFSRLLLRAGRAAEALAARELIQRFRERRSPWKGAPIAGCFAAWLARGLERLPGPFRRCLEPPARKIVLHLGRQSRKERELRSVLSKAYHQAGKALKAYRGTGAR